ncbi:MAG: hypothetical protein AMXMBFR64_40210 [Myxococcales bacterium]
MPRRFVASLVTVTFVCALVPALAAPKPPASGFIVVYSTTVGADILVDGQKVATVPYEEPIPVAPGKHTVVLTKRGFSRFELQLEVKKGKSMEVEADLIASDGILRVLTTNVEGAAVQVNKNVIGKTPFDGLVPAGQHMLRVSKEGYRDSVRKLDVLAGEPIDLVFELEKLAPVQVATTEPIVSSGPEFYETWWFWTITGVVVAGAAVGAGIALAPAEQVTAPSDHVIRFGN